MIIQASLDRIANVYTWVTGLSIRGVVAQAPHNYRLQRSPPNELVLYPRGRRTGRLNQVLDVYCDVAGVLCCGFTAGNDAVSSSDVAIRP